MLSGCRGRAVVVMAVNKQRVIQDAAIKLLDAFKAGQMPEALAISVIRRKTGDDQPSFHWSIGNQILMILNDTADARGFRQWKNVNRFVKKEAKAIYILGPITKTIKEKDDKSGEETVKTIITGFKFIPVFRYEDTEGEPLEKPDYTPVEFPPFWDVAEHLGINVQYTPISGNYYGSYSASNLKITLCSQDAFVFFHELGHAVHDKISGLSNFSVPEREIIAETTAAVLCQLQGISGFESEAYEYLKGYAVKMKEPEVVKAVMKLLSEIEAVVMNILEIAEELDVRQKALA